LMRNHIHTNTTPWSRASVEVPPGVVRLRLALTSTLLEVVRRPASNTKSRQLLACFWEALKSTASIRRIQVCKSIISNRSDHVDIHIHVVRRSHARLEAITTDSHTTRLVDRLGASSVERLEAYEGVWTSHKYPFRRMMRTLWRLSDRIA
jgi:hypothetical protein